MARLVPSGATPSATKIEHPTSPHKLRRSCRIPPIPFGLSASICIPRLQCREMLNRLVFLAELAVLEPCPRGDIGRHVAHLGRLRSCMMACADACHDVDMFSVHGGVRAA
ncbi:hypothetical protein OBBRIDRAFT_790208 [Obba rivulosa]|uniref:Uncharacterized protein n=1 Tax=Obba rivulosa TaxID=1052685 RepID=A0A8E2DPS0_9APHY|nr:hypothetical protein OBBRIDRAFT_790208 [Obba rivulosa]